MGESALPAAVFHDIEPAADTVVDGRELILRGRVAGATKLWVEGQEVDLVDGRFTSHPLRLFGQGTRATILVAENADGHRTEQLHRVRVDWLAPSLTWTRVRDGRVVDDPLLKVRLVVSDTDLAGAEINGQERPVEHASFEAEVELQPGENLIRAAAWDVLGRRTEEVRRVIYDPEPPIVDVRIEVDADPEGAPAEAELASLVDGSWFPRRIRPHVAVADASEVDLEVLVDRKPWSESWIGEGEHRLKVLARDAAGGATVVERRFVVDLEAPVIDKVGPSSARLLGDEDVRVWGRVVDRRGRVERVTVDGVDASLRHLRGHERGGEWKFESPPLSLGEGQVEVEIFAFDEVGHATRLCHVLRRDASAPEVALSAGSDTEVVRTSAADFRIEGMVADSSAVEVRVAGEPVRLERPRQVLGRAPSGPGDSSSPVGGTGGGALSPRVRDDRSESVTEVSEPSAAVAGAVGGAQAFPHRAGTAPPEPSQGASVPFASTTIPLQPGLNRIPVEARDAAGNVSRRTVLVERDVSAPVVEVTVDGVPMADGAAYPGLVSPVITATDPEGGTVTVEATLDALPFTSGELVAGEGSHELVVTATDETELSTSVSLGFVIDSTPPAILGVAPADGSLTNAASVVLTGTVEGATEVRVDGVAADFLDDAFATTALPLAEGDNTFTVDAVDGLGRTTTLEHRIARDSVAPTLGVAQPADGALLAVAETDVSGTASDANLDTVLVSGTPAELSGTAFLAAVPLADGPGEVVVVATDRAGNTIEVRRAVTVDRDAPILAVTDPAPGTVTPDETVTLHGTVADPHLDRVDVDGRRASVTGGTWSIEATLGEGLNSLLVEAFDRLGHRSEVSLEVRRDSTAPAVWIEVPEEDLRTRAPAIDVSGTVEEPPAGEAAATVTVNGVAATVDAGTFAATAVPLVAGENRLTARAVDASGNHGIHVRVVVRDEVPPELVASDPADGALAVELDTNLRLEFSEALADPPVGAWRLETIAGAELAASLDRAPTAEGGETWTVTPDADLPPGTGLNLRLDALADRAGNPLPIHVLNFTTTDPRAPPEPVLDAWPPAVCASTLSLTGTTWPLAVVRVEGGAAAASARADEAGAFAVDAPLRAGTQLLEVVAIDLEGDAGPAAEALVRHDCTPPTVDSAILTASALDVLFSESVDPSTLASAVVVTEVATGGPVPGTVSATAPDTARFTPAAAWPAGDLRLEVATDVADAAGNALAFPYVRLFTEATQESFFAGVALDESTGRPLEGVRVVVTATDGLAPAGGTPEATTGARGRFVVPVPAGTHDVTFSRPGFVPVFRIVTTTAGHGTEVFDPRLQPAADASPLGSEGGVVEGLGGARLEVPSGALATVTDITLTALPEQALPALLPYGYSPRGAIWLQLPVGEALSIPATVTIPVDAPDGTVLPVVELDLGTLQWRVVAVAPVGNGALTAPLSGTGALAVVEADSGVTAPATPVIGEVLGSGPAPLGGEVTSATITFDPAVVLPTMTAAGEVRYVLDPERLASAASGLPLVLRVEEELELADGTVRREAPYLTDLVLYRDDAGQPRSRFSLRPSTAAASLPVRLGVETVEIFPYADESVRGDVLGPDGGEVTSEEGDRFTVPAGALAGPTALVVERGAAEDLPIPIPAGTTLAGVLRLETGGASLATPGQLHLAAGIPVPEARGLVLRVVEVEGTWRWQAVAEAEPEGAGWRSRLFDPADLPWPGVRDEGLFAFVELDVAPGFLRGVVTESGGASASSAVVEAEPSGGAPFGWLQLTDAAGRYALPVRPGALVASARDAGGEQAVSVATDVPAADDRIDLDLALLVVPPWVAEISPADGASGVPVGIEPWVRFSEAVDPASVEGEIELRLDGVAASVALDVEGATVRLVPTSPLVPETTYEIRVGTGVVDLDGHAVATGATTTFTTGSVELPTEVRRDRIHLIAPDGSGEAQVLGLAGAVPGEATVFVENLTSLAATETRAAAQDGSFDLRIAASLDDRLLFHLLVDGGNEIVLLLGPWRSFDLDAARIGPEGGEFTTGGGMLIAVEPDTFDAPTWVRATLGAALPAPEDIVVHQRFDLDLGGAVAKKPLGIRLAAPAASGTGGPWLLMRRVQALGESGWMLDDVLTEDGGDLTNGRFPVAAEGVQATVEKSVSAGDPGTTLLRPPARFRGPQTGPVVGLVQVERETSGEGGLPTRSTATATVVSRSGAVGAQARSFGGIQSYLTGPFLGGVYQVVRAPIDTAFAVIGETGRSTIAFFERTWDGFIAVMDDAWSFIQQWAVLLVREGGDFEIEAKDYSTGYTLWRETFPAPSAGGTVELPDDVWGALPPPMPIAGSPLRYHLVGAVPGPAQELEPGIFRSILEGGQLEIRGEAGSVPKETTVHLVGVDDASSAESTAAADGSFVLVLEDPVAGNRYLVGLGAHVGSTDGLEIELSNASGSDLGGFSVWRYQNGEPNVEVAVKVEPVSSRQRLRIAPYGGWVEGRHVLRIDEGLTDGIEDENGVAGSWGRSLDVDFVVVGTTVHDTYGAIGPTRDLLRMGSLIFVAAEQQGVRVLDASDPRQLVNYFQGELGVPLPLQDPVRGLAADEHGRIVAVGGGVVNHGQLRFLDPTQLVRGASTEADRVAAWAGTVLVSRKLGEDEGALAPSTPRRVALLDGSSRDQWTFDPSYPMEIEGLTFTVTPAADDAYTVRVAGIGHADQPVTLRNLTRGRWSRTDAASGDGTFAVAAEVRRGDRLELLRSSGSVAYVTLDGVGLAAVDLEAVWRNEISVELLASQHQKLYRGFQVDACPGSSSQFNAVDVDVLPPTPGVDGQPWTVPTLVFGYGLVILEMDPGAPDQLSALSTVCGGIDGVTQTAGMAVMPSTPIRIEKKVEGENEGEFEIEVEEKTFDLIAMTNRAGWVLLADVTDRSDPVLLEEIEMPGPVSAIKASADGSRLYVSGYGGGVYIVELKVIPDDVEADADGDGKDDRILETIPVPDENLSTALLLDDGLGMGWVGGLEQGVTPVTLGVPQIRFLDGEGLRYIDRLSPFGVPNSSDEQKADGSPKAGSPTAEDGDPPGYFRVEARLPASLLEDDGTIHLNVVSVSPAGAEIPAAGEHEGLPQTGFWGDEALELRPQSTLAWEEGSTFFLSDPVVAIADLRASFDYGFVDDEPTCWRCNLVTEKVYGVPLPATPWPELLSGHAVEARMTSEMAVVLSELYGEDRIDAATASVASVPWDTTPSPEQEPTLHPSYGTGDVAPGTLLHSGEMTLTATDVAIRGRVLDIAFTRSYRNQTVGAGPLGPGWDHVFRQRVRELPNGNVELYDGRGRRELFLKHADPGKYSSPKGLFSELHQVASGWVLVDPQRNTTRFDRWGRLQSFSDALRTNEDRGSELRFHYDGSGQLSAIEDDLERSISLRYDEDGRLSQLEDFDGRVWTYGYDFEGRLETVEAPTIEVKTEAGLASVAPTTRYGYDLSPQDLRSRLAKRDDLVSVADAKSQTWLQIDYDDIDEDGRRQEVTSQVWGGHSLSIAREEQTGRVKVTDRRGHVWTYEHDDEGHVELVLDPTAAADEDGTAFEYDGESRLRLVTLPRTEEGGATRRRVAYDYPAGEVSVRRRGNVQAIRELPDGGLANGSAASLETRFEYHPEVNLPTLITDPRGMKTLIERSAEGLPERIVRASKDPDEETEISVPASEWDAYGRPQRVTLSGPSGKTGTFESTTRYEYFESGESEGYLRRVTVDPGGLDLVTRYETDARGNVEAVIDPRGVRHETDWNDLDWPTETRAATTGVSGAPPLSLTTTLHYDANGQVAEVVEPSVNGFGTVSTTVERGVLGETRSVTKGDVTTSWAYDETFNVTEITDPEQRKVKLVWNPRHLLEERILAPDTAKEVSESWLYDSTGLASSHVEATGTVRSFQRDRYGRLRRIDDPAGVAEPGFTTVEYDFAGALERVTRWALDAETPENSLELAQIEWDRDVLGRVTSEIQGLPLPSPPPPPSGLTAGPLSRKTDGLGPIETRFDHDALGNVVQVLDPDGEKTKVFFDKAGRLEWIEDPLGNRTTYGLDEAGNVASITELEQSPSGTVTRTTETRFDGVGRPVKQIEPDGREWVFEYDGRGNLGWITDPAGNFTVRTHDEHDRLKTVTRPEGIVADYGYDLNSRVRRYDDALGQQTVYVWDQDLDRLAKVIYPGGVEESYSYDAAGRSTGWTDPTGRTVVDHLDPLGRPYQRDIASGGSTITETYRWDPMHLLREIWTPSGDLTRLNYDRFSRLEDEGTAFAGSETGTESLVSYDYDSSGGLELLVSSRSVDSRALDYVPDALDRASSIATAYFDEEGQLTSTVAHAGFQYQGTSRVAERSLQWGTTPLVGTSSYDASGRLERQQVVEGTEDVFDEVLVRDGRDLVKTATRADLDLQRFYDYDKAGRLRVAEMLTVDGEESRDRVELPNRWSFTYDAAENLRSQETTAVCASGTFLDMPLDGSGRNRPGELGEVDLEWDVMGNLVRKGGTVLRYDVKNRLVAVEEPDGSRVEYVYDGLDRRIRKKHFEPGEEDPDRVEDTVWAGWQPIETWAHVQVPEGEPAVPPVPESTRVYGLGLDEIVTLTTSTGHYRPIYDASGNVAMLVADDGQIVERYEYSPYGQRWVLPNDLTPPVLEQARLVGDDEIWLEISEQVRSGALAEAVERGDVTVIDVESSLPLPIVVAQPIQTGRQAGRRIVIRIEPDEPLEVDQALRVEVRGAAMEDLFGNRGEDDVVTGFFFTEEWTVGNTWLEDAARPRLEQICRVGDRLVVELSEEVDLIEAAVRLQIDGAAVDWQLGADRYSLTSEALEEGEHEFSAEADQPLDLAGQGLLEGRVEGFERGVEPEELVWAAPNYGVLRESTVANRYGFHGLEEDPDTGLIYARHRWLDPEIGRFVSPDLLGYVDGPSMVQYAANDPVNKTDPMGLEAGWILQRDQQWRSELDPEGTVELSSVDCGYLWGTAQGFLLAPTDAVKGGFTAVRHPVLTVGALMYAIDNPATVLAEGIVDFERADACDRGYVIGGLAAGGGLGGATVKTVRGTRALLRFGDELASVTDDAIAFGLREGSEEIRPQWRHASQRVSRQVINPALQVRRDAYVAWMARRGIQGRAATLHEFKFFKRGNAGEAGKRLYARKSGFGGRALERNRRLGVKLAWEAELALLQRGLQGTRAWSPGEIIEFLSSGRIKGYYGHHINSVARNPHMAADPRNIEFVTWAEHFARHGGNWQNPTSGPLVNR